MFKTTILRSSLNRLAIQNFREDKSSAFRKNIMRVTIKVTVIQFYV